MHFLPTQIGLFDCSVFNYKTVFSFIIIIDCSTIITKTLAIASDTCLQDSIKFVLLRFELTQEPTHRAPIFIQVERSSKVAPAKLT